LTGDRAPLLPAEGLRFLGDACDGGLPEAAARAAGILALGVSVTFLVYLNEDYDGGETAFPDLGFAHRGRHGDGLYFVNTLPDLSPNLRMVHAGRPITRGEKWIVTQFVRSRPTR
jgi:hypothetical protein